MRTKMMPLTDLGTQTIDKIVSTPLILALGFANLCLFYPLPKKTFFFSSLTFADQLKA